VRIAGYRHLTSDVKARYGEFVAEYLRIIDADATLPAVVLDVLLPPYVEPERPCNYYKAVKDPTAPAGEQGWWLEKAADPADALLPYTVRYNGFKPKLQKRG
jgi:hypothetical protein